MATYRKFIYVNDDGDYQEHDGANDQLQLHSIKLGAAATAPAVNGLSLLGNIDLNDSGRVRNALDPIYADELANKRYVDAIAAGLLPKSDVRVATTASSDLTGYTYVNANDNNTTATPLVWTGVSSAPTIDGILLADGDRLLIKDSTNQKGNGVFTYDATAQGFRRASDCDNVSIIPNSEVKGGLFVFVTSGTANAAKGYIMSAPETIVTLGTNNIVFATFTSPGPIEADEVFLSRIGNVIHFEFLNNNNVVIGNALNHPAAVNTTTAMVAGYTGGAHHILASSASGLVIKAGAIEDENVAAAANIQTSKSQVDSGFAPGASTNAPVSISGGDTALVALQKLQQAFNALGNTAVMASGVGANLVGLPSDIKGFSASTDTVAEAISELAGEDMVVTNAQTVTVGDLLYVAAAGTVQAYTDVSVIRRPVGVAAATVVGDGVKTVKVITNGSVVRALAGATLTPGTRYFWNPAGPAVGSDAWVSVQTGFAGGDYIFQVGVGKTTTEGFVQFELVKKNA